MNLLYYLSMMMVLMTTTKMTTNDDDMVTSSLFREQCFVVGLQFRELNLRALSHVRWVVHKKLHLRVCSKVPETIIMREREK